MSILRLVAVTTRTFASYSDGFFALLIAAYERIFEARLQFDSSLAGLITRIVENPWLFMITVFLASILASIGMGQNAKTPNEHSKGDNIIAASAAITCFVMTLLAYRKSHR
ncbi:hypothetical protein LshimejAT787_0212030 [Lyophyllum shimeji]|uniref:Uncharacterized protein n=1 Tax=Lyophyllum shimeji TaxID=47721 RepID=A0A9P3PGR4_LYOSH|nr:hypothetical protein LshimejAT787_0212030 [Lyophyllum shimeji]